MARQIGLRSFMGAALVLLVTACATPVEVDYDTSRDFSRLRTYAWVEPSSALQPPPQQPQPPQDPVLYNSLTDRRVHQSVDSLLAARGFRRVDPAGADFLVTYHLGLANKLDSSNFGFGVGYGWHHAGVAASDGFEIEQYEEESLLIDLLDRHTRELIWRGSVREPLDRYLSAQERTAHIHRQVTDILSRFPPQ